MASLVHRRGLLDNPVLADEVVAAAGLALENERLHAELLAQERELRASRARVVAAGDSERRRLERNLHDGSQQRLIGLLLSARYAQSLLGPGAGAAIRARVDRLVAELELSIDELRRIAHGIHPAVLTDEGLGRGDRVTRRRRSTRCRSGRFPTSAFPPGDRTTSPTASSPKRRLRARPACLPPHARRHARGRRRGRAAAGRPGRRRGPSRRRRRACSSTGSTVDGTVTMKVELPCG